MEYLLFFWPDSQEYMEKPWFFDEAILMNDEKHLDTIGSAAYFIPKERVVGNDPDDCSNEYVLIDFPDSQDYMDNEDCILGDDSSIFVPKRLL